MSLSPQTPAEHEENILVLKAEYAQGEKIVASLMVNQETLATKRQKLVRAIKDTSANLAFIKTAPVPILSEWETVKNLHNSLAIELSNAEGECAKNFTLLAAATTDMLNLRALIERLESNPIDNVQELFPQ